MTRESRETSADPQAPTFSFEDSLPRVPVPDLDRSAGLFLEWCGPLLTEEQRAETMAAVAELTAPDSPARRAYARLVSREQEGSGHSWVDEFWRDRYRGRRVPISINANVFFLFHDRSEPQLDRAAGVVMGALDHKAAVDAERLPVSMQRGAPMSMEQHRALFSTTRIPGIPRDTVRRPYSDAWPGPSTERHVVVARDGHLYRFDVLGPDGAPHTVSEIRSGLQQIVDDAADRGQRAGCLTTLPRAEWSGARERLLAVHPDNAAVLDTIERALVVVCLDLAAAEDIDTACMELLAGDGGSRWFDKAISFVVLADGRAGLNAEHCELDGTVMAELIDSIETVPVPEHEARAGARPQGIPRWADLTFVLDDELAADIDRSDRRFQQFKSSTVGRQVTFPDVNPGISKSLGCSPDAFCQLAFQLAHHRARGLVGATYESVSTRRYHHGRTEAMRVVTPEIVAFVDAMAAPGRDAAERGRLARAAAAAHVARARASQESAAPEQLLWELQLELRRSGESDDLALYGSPGWLVMRDDYLSTSSVPSANVVIFGFGATSGHCIGISYQFVTDRLSLYLSAPADVGDDLRRFVAELPGAITDLTEVLRITAG